MKKNIFTIPLFSYNYNGDMDLLENNIQENAKLGRGVKRSNVNGFQSRPAAHYTIKPRAGDVYLWPSYLYHSVDSNTQDVERISISFNLS